MFITTKNSHRFYPLKLSAPEICRVTSLEYLIVAYSRLDRSLNFEEMKGPVHNYNLRKSKRSIAGLDNYASCSELSRPTKKAAISKRLTAEDEEHNKIVGSLSATNFGEHPGLALSHLHRIVEDHLNWMDWQPLPLSPTGLALLRNGRQFKKCRKIRC